jgi:hypothetical protein
MIHEPVLGHSAINKESGELRFLRACGKARGMHHNIFGRIGGNDRRFPAEERDIMKVCAFIVYLGFHMIGKVMGNGQWVMGNG